MEQITLDSLAPYLKLNDAAEEENISISMAAVGQFKMAGVEDRA